MNAATLILQLLGFLVVAWQLRVLIRTLESMRKDHDHQRRLASIESIGEIYRECRFSLESRFGTNCLVESDIKTIEENQEYEATIVKLLSVLEHISVGINTGIYDKDIIFRMSAGSMISLYHRLELYIKHRQRKYNPKSYIDFEELIREFETRKGIRAHGE